MAGSLIGQNDPCHKVRFADIGWTDVSATTALAAELLKALGYETDVSLYSLPVTLAGLKNNDIDVFLGNWMPAQESDVRPFLNENSLRQIHKNLTGARYTLAVPAYVYDAGVHSIRDVARYAERFKHQIHGIEPGNDGNRLIISMINENAFDLKDFEIVESSEQGMLQEVKNAVLNKQWIVFLGWSPHPMNISVDMKYLSDGDDYFGANFGAAEVYTLSRRNFAVQCPNLFTFFHNLTFSLEIENSLMKLILENKLSAQEAAQQWLKEHPDAAALWLKGVFDAKGQSGRRAFAKHNALMANHKPNAIKRLPLGEWIERAVGFVTTHASTQLRSFSTRVEWLVDGLSNYLLSLSWMILLGILTFISWLIRRSIKISLVVFMGLLLIVNLGLWNETIQTMVLVILASCISVVLGVPLGIVAAHRPRFYLMLRPLLDSLQTIPTFVYLIPTLMLFGLGLVPGLISTVIFAISAPIRLTYLGIKAVPSDLIEAGESFGATSMQRLIKIEIPYALPSILAGFTQCIMLSLSMVVIAALVGVEGLGTPVIRALNTVNIALGFEAGIAIVILAIVLDRTLSFGRADQSAMK